MNGGQRFFHRAYKSSHGFYNFNRKAQANLMNNMTLNMAQSSLYANQLRFQSTIIPLNAMALMNVSELEDEVDNLLENDDLEEDVL